MKKRILSILLSVALVSTLMVATAGCGKKDVEEEVTTEAVRTEVATTEEPDIGPEGMARSYLTGEWIDEELAKKRPVAFMIENTSMSQPSSNSSNADVYYEAPEEGGVTRIMGIYGDISGLGTIGNIRSTRPYFVYSAIAFNAILAHCGGSIETYQELLDRGKIDNLDERVGAGGFFRESARSAPQNLYATSDGIQNAIKSKGYSEKYSETYEGYLNFNKDDENEIELEDGMDCAVVTVYQPDNKPWFVYNEKEKLYYRYQFGTEQMDEVTGKQLAVKNVIIQEVSVNAYFDEEEHDRVDVGIVGKGNGKYITNGKCVDITWECGGNGQKTTYYDVDGNVLKLNQGKTWINVMDRNYATSNMVYSTLEIFENVKSGSSTTESEEVE